MKELRLYLINIAWMEGRIKGRPAMSYRIRTPTKIIYIKYQKSKIDGIINIHYRKIQWKGRVKERLKTYLSRNKAILHKDLEDKQTKKEKYIPIKDRLYEILSWNK